MTFRDSAANKHPQHYTLQQLVVQPQVVALTNVADAGGPVNVTGHEVTRSRITESRAMESRSHGCVSCGNGMIGITRPYIAVHCSTLQYSPVQRDMRGMGCSLPFQTSKPVVPVSRCNTLLHMSRIYSIYLIVTASRSAKD